MCYSSSPHVALKKFFLRYSFFWTLSFVFDNFGNEEKELIAMVHEHLPEAGKRQGRKELLLCQSLDIAV